MQKLALSLLTILSISLSCTKESGSVSGSWVTEMADQPQHKYGFTLKDDGKATAINLGEMAYEKWEKQGDLLLLYAANPEGKKPVAQDTFKIISVADSVLILEKDGRRLRYAKTSNPEKLVNDFEIYECFVYKFKKDSAFLHINIADSIATGELNYLLSEKDSNLGKIEGRLHGDTLFANYTFSSEGRESVREVAFLKQGINWREGFGESMEKDSVMVFKDKSKLRFRGGMLFRGVKCP